MIYLIMFYHTFQNRAGLRQFLDSFGGSEHSTMNGNSISVSQELSSESVTSDNKQDIKPRADVKVGHVTSGNDSSVSPQTSETRLADLLDSTLWNRRLAPSSERIVYALVQQIFHGIREYFLASTELKVRLYMLKIVYIEYREAIREYFLASTGLFIVIFF